MIAQRRGAAKTTPEPATKPRSRKRDAPPPPSTNPPSASQKRKMSFKETHAHRTLPARIEALEAGAERLQAMLADPGYYARDPEAFARTAAELEAVNADLAAAEDQWLHLELLRDELEYGES
jgi:ATP-binding cassette subfamily F protein uup